MEKHRYCEIEVDVSLITTTDMYSLLNHIKAYRNHTAFGSNIFSIIQDVSFQEAFWKSIITGTIEIQSSTGQTISQRLHQHIRFHQRQAKLSNGLG